MPNLISLREYNIADVWGLLVLARQYPRAIELEPMADVARRNGFSPPVVALAARIDDYDEIESQPDERIPFGMSADELLDTVCPEPRTAPRPLLFLVDSSRDRLARGADALVTAVTDRTSA